MGCKNIGGEVEIGKLSEGKQVTEKDRELMSSGFPTALLPTASQGSGAADGYKGGGEPLAMRMGGEGGHLGKRCPVREVRGGRRELTLGPRATPGSKGRSLDTWAQLPLVKFQS